MKKNSSTQLIKDSIAQCQNLLPIINNIGETQDYFDIYYMIEHLVQSIQSTYTQIPCRINCSLCCQDTFPEVSFLEWKLIFNYLHTLPSIELEKILHQNEKLYRNQIHALINIQSLIETNSSSSGKDYQLTCSICPFLIEDQCSIYPVRPAICRGYGYFSIEHPGQSNTSIFGCYMVSDSFQNLIQPDESFILYLPFWNKIKEKIYDLNTKHQTISILPLWLMIHSKNNKLLNEVEKNPDFNELKLS